VQCCLRGDKEAFTELARSHSGRLYAIAYGKLSSHQEAEDIVQDTLVFAYQRLGQLRQPDSFRAWVSRIAVRLSDDRGKKRRREMVDDLRQHIEEAPDPVIQQEQFVHDEDVRQVVSRALAIMPESLRVAVAMRYMGHASYEEIAETLGVSRRSAETYVTRGKNQAREYLTRSGRADAATGPLRSLAGAALAADAIVESAMNAVRGMPTPAAGASYASGSLAAGGVGGAFLIGLAICAIGGAALSWTFHNAGDVEEDETMHAQLVGGFPTDSGSSTTRAGTTERRTALRVDPTVPWNATGIRLSRGDAVRITAEGTWLLNTNQADGDGFDADGDPLAAPGTSGPPGTAGWPSMTANVGALIGKIGEFGEPFSVGSLAKFDSGAEGVLYLGVNDSRFSDNDGSLNVAVTVY
jgi:RNA polymerase sigma-70 factor, ECF subfamily